MVNVPSFDVIQGHDEVAEFAEEGDGQFSNIFMVSMDVEVGVNKLDGFFGHECLRLTLMLSLEQELPVQVRNLSKRKHYLNGIHINDVNFANGHFT